jgi:hypothetical protein
VANEPYVQKFWLWEIWLENRETFKLIVADTAKFIIIIILIFLGHKVIEWLPLDADRKKLLDWFHFHGLVATWVLFALTLLLEITIDILKRIKEHSS